MNVMYRMILFCLLIGIIIGCSSEDSKDSDIVKPTVQLDSTYYIPPAEIVTIKDSIELMLNDAMARLRYDDNSGLFENEFAYLTDDITFDEYLGYGQIKTPQPADVEKIYVKAVDMFDHDSAFVTLDVYLAFKEGGRYDTLQEHMMVYYHNGRWIKPTVSVISHQKDYDSLIRAAEEAASWED